MQNEIDKQYKIALISPYGKVFHSRDQSFFEQQKFLFRSNMAEQLARFGNIPKTDYTTVMPLGSTSQSLIMHNDTDISRTHDAMSSFSQRIIDAHEEQQQLQRAYIAEIGITSNTAATILAMNNQAVLAIEAMQDVASVPISNQDARAMLIAADSARSTSWLNVVDDTDSSYSNQYQPTSPHQSTCPCIRRIGQAS
jgi:hypothetical protein